MTGLSSTKTASVITVPTRITGVLSRWRTDKKAYPLGYVASLDGIRGLMTLGVLLAHTYAPLFGGAMIFMDVFFAMSGYLITSLLIADYQKRGKISLRKFYARRFMRLYPALALMVATLVIMSWLFSADFKTRLTEAAIAFFYLMDYVGMFGVPIYYTGHTWSLAVEEQFYLLWPLTFILLLRLWGLSWKTAAIVFAMAIAFAAWRVYLTYGGAPIWRLFGCFDTRADALLAGCGLAIVLKFVDFRDYPRVSKILAWSLAPLAVVGLALCFVMNLNMRWYYYVSPLVGAIPGIIITAALVQPTRTFMHRFYEHPLPVYCGRICYGLYVWHFPIFIWVYEWGKPRHIVAWALVLIAWPLVFAVASASYFIIERRFMRARPL